MKLFISLLLTLGLFLWNQFGQPGTAPQHLPQSQTTTAQNAETIQIPEYEGKIFTVFNNNIPNFTKEEKEYQQRTWLRFTPLDQLKRCGTAYGLIGPETMPTEKRKPIGMVKPSGWQIAKYDIVDQGYVYNRCHLLAFQLTGENANPLNLITGTRFLNTRGMLPLENRTADYIKHTKNHVLYRVTPLFKNNELVARGVHMEAWSLEDNGKLHFNVFVHNIQPGIDINYQNGKTKKL